MHTYANTAQDDTQDYSAQKIAPTSQILASLNRFFPIPQRNKQPIQNKSNCTITTPIDSDALAKYLEGYDPELSQFLVTGFSLGFRIPYFVYQIIYHLLKRISQLDFKKIHKNFVLEE